MGRTQGLVVREKDFVGAAIVGGLSHGRIIRMHILPHVVASAIVQATLGMEYVVLFEARGA